MFSILHWHDQSLGALLKQWRANAGVSQIALALEVGISTRYLSFIESNKASPSESLLYKLLKVLNVPESQRNAVLLAAGFKPVSLKIGISRNASVDALLERLLSTHTQTPIIVKDAIWDVIKLNSVAERFLTSLMGKEKVAAAPLMNVLEWIFLPNYLRPHILNWKTVASSLIRHIRQEVGFAADHPEFRQVLETVSQADGFAQRWQEQSIDTELPMATQYQFAHHGRVLTFESIIMSLGSPYEAVLRGIRLDNFLPADDITRDFLAQLCD